MKKLMAVVLAAMLALMLVSCGSGTENSGSEELLPGEEFKTEEFKEENKISTPYIVFNRADLWAEDMTVSTVDEDNVLKLLFTSKVGEETVDLFTVVFADEFEQGFMIGSLKGANVFLQVETIERQEGWTDDQFDKINLMQEYINDIIWQLHQNENFVPVEQK